MTKPKFAAAITGEQLYDELRNAAAKTTRSLSAYVAPLFNGVSWKLEQLRISRKPTAATIERVRALISGAPLPPTRAGYDRDPRAFGLSRVDAEAAGIPPSARSVTDERSLVHQNAARERTAWLLDLSEQARLTRRPGQTMHDRFEELRAELR